MSKCLGRASIQFDEPVYILESASVVGKKEGEGPLGLLFDFVGEDDLFGKESWEEAESALQKQALGLALQKAGLRAEDINLMFAGDLLGQSIATSFGISGYQIPMLGVYGACSTCGESLSLGAMTVAAGYADYCLTTASSHFGSAEKQFRYRNSERNRPMPPPSLDSTVGTSSGFPMLQKTLIF